MPNRESPSREMPRRLFLAACAASAAGACKRQDAPAPKDAGVEEVQLWFGGDVHLGDTTPKIEGLSRWLTPASIGVVNLEGPIGGAPYADIDEKSVRLSNDAAAVAGLAKLGVKVVGIANNHIADRAGGANDTKRAIERAKMHAAANAELMIGKRRLVVSAINLPSQAPPLRAATGDLLVVSIHVTGPPSYLPKPTVKDAVEKALAAGARVVVVHGTHAWGPVERRGNRIIAWGLGNLLFNCTCSPSLEGLIMHVTVRGDDTDAVVVPIDAGLMGQSAKPTADPTLALDVLASIGSSPLTRHDDHASF